MEYESIPGGHRWDLGNGAAIEVIDTAWTQRGRLYANVQILADGGALAAGNLVSVAPVLVQTSSGLCWKNLASPR